MLAQNSVTTDAHATDAHASAAADDDDDARVLDVCDLRFAHAVNTRALLRAALADARVNVLEGDVITRTGADGVVRAVMGHNPLPQHARDDAGDELTLVDWLTGALAASRGVKVDLKEHAALAPALAALRAQLPGWVSPDPEGEEGGEGVGGDAAAAASDAHFTSTRGRVPLLRLLRSGATSCVPCVIVNADVLSGPRSSGAPACTFNASGAPAADAAAEVDAARAFVAAVAAALPLAIVSCGWTTRGEGSGCAEWGLGWARGAGAPPHYDVHCVARMLAAVGDAADEGVRLAFPLRASWLSASLKRGTLAPLQLLPGAHVCVWSNVPLARGEAARLRAAMPAATCFDLIEDLAVVAPPPSPAQPWLSRAALVAVAACTAAACAAVATAAALAILRARRPLR